MNVPSQSGGTSFFSNNQSFSHFIGMNQDQVNRALTLFSQPTPEQNNVSIFGSENTNQNNRPYQENRPKKSRKSKEQRVYQ